MDARLRQRLERLRNLAERAGTEAEATVAAHKLQHILTLHNIEMQDVERESLKSAFGIENVLLGRDNWKRILINGLARLNNVYAYLPQDRQYVALAGRADNIQTVQWLYELFEAQLHRLSWNAYDERVYQVGKRAAGNKRAFTNSFLHGAVQRLLERLKEQKRTTEEQSKALVLDELREVQRYLYSEHNLRLGTASKPRYGSASGYHAGQAAGGRVNLDKHVNAPGTKALRG